jgi:hypothetical protein
MLGSIAVRSSLFGLLAVGCAGAAPGPDERPADRAPAAAAAPLAGPLRCAGVDYRLRPPPGWRAAAAAGSRDGELVLRRSAGDGAALSVRCETGPLPVGALLERDKDLFGRRSSLVVVGEVDPLRSASGERIELRTFSGGVTGPCLAVAYVVLGEGALRLALETDTQAACDRNLGALEHLLSSFASLDWSRAPL